MHHADGASARAGPDEDPAAFLAVAALQRVVGLVLGGGEGLHLCVYVEEAVHE